MSDNRPMKLLLFYIALLVVLYGALTLTFRRDASMIHFLYICIAVTDIMKRFSSRIAVCVLHIFTLLLMTDAYIFEIETAHYVSSFTLDLLHPYWGYFLKWRLQLPDKLFFFVTFCLHMQLYLPYTQFCRAFSPQTS